VCLTPLLHLLCCVCLQVVKSVMCWWASLDSALLAWTAVCGWQQQLTAAAVSCACGGRYSFCVLPLCLGCTAAAAAEALLSGQGSFLNQGLGPAQQQRQQLS
jgi:hypothetical protein